MTMGRHSEPLDGAVTANGHALVPFTIPPGPVSAWPQDNPVRSRTPADKPGRRRPDGTAFIVVALFAVAQVAVVAFSGSWQHQYELSVHLGQAHWVAGMQPLSVEGLIASATLVIWYAARYKVPHPPLGAYLVLAAGVGQTVLMNVGADYRWPWLGPEISVWPAVAFVAAYEMAVWLVRKRQDASGDPVVTPRHDSDHDKGDKPQRKPPPPAKRPAALTKQARAAAAIRDNPGLTNAALAKLADVDVRTIQRARNGKTGSVT